MVQVDTSKHVACSRTNHTDYIELVFEESSKQAVDQLITHLIDIASVRDDADIKRIYINSGKVKNTQPIMYLMNQLRVSKSQLKSNDSVRIAVTFNILTFAQMINIFITTMRSPQMVFRAFGVHQIDQAVPWLLSDSD